jgi:uncharacterized membrane protein YphA (DoxX/SURF4 family)
MRANFSEFGAMRPRTTGLALYAPVCSRMARFAGGRIPGTARWFYGMGMRPGWLHARVAAVSEVAAGLGLAVGLLTPVAAAGFVA